MNKVLKKIIYVIGLTFLIIVLALNLIYTSNMQKLEIVIVKNNNLFFLISAILVSIVIFIMCGFLNENSKKIKGKYILLGIAIYIYAFAQILIIKYNNSSPGADQKTTYDLAVAMTNNSIEEFLDNGTTYAGNLENRIYVERYQQQIPLAFIWSIIFRLFNCTSYYIIQYLNILCNVITAVSVFLICKELSKKYSVNKYLAVTLILTFVSIPLLVTFVYGDFSGLALAMLGTYFIMKYCSERKWRYLIFSIISIAISYMVRMNNLIYIIAIVIYLFLDLISNKEQSKVILTKITAIICFIILTFLPTILVKQYYINKIGLDGSKSFPKTGYFLTGMSESVYAPRLVFV